MIRFIFLFNTLNKIIIIKTKINSPRVKINKPEIIEKKNILLFFFLSNNINKNLKNSSEKIICDIMVNFKLIECRDVFNKFLVENNFDVKKFNVLTSIVWLNMAPLHEHPLNKFLFYFGKYNLYKNLMENK